MTEEELKQNNEKFNLNECLFRSRNVTLLYYIMEIPGRTLSFYSRKTDITYSHTVNIIRNWTECGLVTNEVKGRCKSVNITKKGRQLINFLVTWSKGEVENVERPNIH